MKRIVNRKIYDTEKAKLIAESNCSEPRNSFGFFEEYLYKTKNGNWFLMYYGGAATKYAVENSNAWSDSTGIHPLTKNDVCDWLERNGHTEKLEEYFSDWIMEA
jgi:hypothetical protein